jgi:hypothetical protein
VQRSRAGAMCPGLSPNKKVGLSCARADSATLVPGLVQNRPYHILERGHVEHACAIWT